MLSPHSPSQQSHHRRLYSRLSMIQPACLSPSSGPYPMGFLQADIWRGESLRSWSPDLWSWLLLCSLLSGSWANPFHVIITSAKAAPYLHINNQFFLVGKHNVLQSALLLLAPGQLHQDIIINALSGVLVTCCVAPPGGTRVASWGLDNVNIRLRLDVWRLYCFSLIRWYVADTRHNVASISLLSNPGRYALNGS